MKPQIASWTSLPQVLTAGDLAPDCILPDASGNQVNLRADSIAGNPIVIAFCPRPAAASAAALTALSRHFEAFAAQGARIFAVSPVPVTVEGSSVPLLLDRQEQVFSSFTVSRNRPTLVVLRRNHYVAGIFSGDVDDQAAAVLALLEGMASEGRTALMGVHPPVLLIPEVLSRDDCARLISVFETRGQTFVEERPPIRDFLNGADFKMRVPEYGRKDRVDHFFFEKITLAFLNQRLSRIAPEIVKAFHYRISQWETLRVACYEGERGGHTHGHRDNSPPTPYRRFAMSINLNTERFEGGELRFPEFGDQRYRPESGTAIVFSSSLLHEALHVTAGRRYVLLAFLF